MELNFERRPGHDGAVTGSARSTLVLIHGIGSRWQMWEPVLDRLAAEHDVIALDLPGFGDSPPAPPGTPAGSRGLAELVARFLARHGVERPHVVGNSLGGLVALQLGAAGRAASVTGLSPAGFANGPESRWATSWLLIDRWLARAIGGHADRLSARAWFRRLAYWQMVGSGAHLAPLDVAESIRALAGASDFERNLRAVSEERFALSEPMDVPVTIAWGERDRLLPPRQAARAAARVPGARIVRLANCGHIPTYDDPVLVAQVILEGTS